MKDLGTCSDEEFQDFLNSFNVILSDVDGVLWNVFASIPGAADALESLQKLGKRIIFVSNNTAKSMDFFCNQFKDIGFDVNPDNIITPAHAYISFLKKHDLTNKQVFVMGMDPLKEELKSAGFDVAETGYNKIEENVHEFVKITRKDDGKVGAVVADIDLNMNIVNLQKGITFLERSEVLFLKGATDLRFPIGSNKVVTGPGFFMNIMEEMTGRKAIALAKPSIQFNESIVEKYEITDKSKVLFIGDSIPEDMAFAANCGYIKLLVFSGLSKKEDVENWVFPEEWKPDFYADSVKVVHDLILRIYGNDFLFF